MWHFNKSKDLEFEKPFGRLGKWKVGKRAVTWFGFTPEQQGTGDLLQQVGVHHYAAKNDFVIDPPFGIVMKRKNAPQPYFVAWLANADLLGVK